MSASAAFARRSIARRAADAPRCCRRAADFHFFLMSAMPYYAAADDFAAADALPFALATRRGAALISQQAQPLNLRSRAQSWRAKRDAEDRKHETVRAAKMRPNINPRRRRDKQT